MRKTAMIILGLLLSVTIVGCGSSDKTSSSSGDYCKTLKASKDQITKFTGNDVPTGAEFDSFVEKVATLEDQAPKDVADDWKTLGGELTKLSSALKEAGIDFDELAQMIATGKLPDGVDAAAALKLSQSLSDVSSNKDFDKAADAISKQAKTECGVTISVS